MSYLRHILKNLQVAGYCLLLFFGHFIHAFYPFKGGHRFLYYLDEKATELGE